LEFQPDQQRLSIEDAVCTLCTRFDVAYWLEKDWHGGFPHDFHLAMAKAGWLGITEDGVFGLQSGVLFGSEAQKQRFPPSLVRGGEKACFGVPEPDVGFNWTHLKVRVERVRGDYVLHGRKVWISAAQVADRVLILTHTMPIEQCSTPAPGMTLFYAPLDRRYVDVREIDNMGRRCVESNELAIDGLPVPYEGRDGEERRGAQGRRLRRGADRLGAGSLHRAGLSRRCAEYRHLAGRRDLVLPQPRPRARCVGTRQRACRGAPV